MPNPTLSSLILPVKDQTTGEVTNVTYDLPAGGGGTVTVDDEISSTSENPVQNKVISAALDLKADSSSLGTAATRNVPTSGNANATQVVLGSDTRLTNSRPASDVYDWAKAETKPTYTASEVGLGNVGNFKAVSTVASQGLSDTEKSNARTNIGAGTSNFSGSYNDLTNKPTIPTVNDATLTIQKNGTTVKTFTANASSNVTANITVPTKVSELTNDSGYTTNTGTVTSVKVGSTSYSPTSGVVSLPAYPTDTNDAVTQTSTSTNANYEVLFSATADNTTRTEGARKYSNLKFNPSTGNLQATQLNGVTIGSSPKFTDTRDFKLGTSRSGASDNTLYFVYST